MVRRGKIPHLKDPYFTSSYFYFVSSGPNPLTTDSSTGYYLCPGGEANRACERPAHAENGGPQVYFVPCDGDDLRNWAAVLPDPSTAVVL